MGTGDVDRMESVALVGVGGMIFNDDLVAGRRFRWLLGGRLG